MLEGLIVLRDREVLTAPAGRLLEDFNDLLRRAQEAFPEARRLQYQQPLRAEAMVMEVITRLSIVKGSIDSELMRLRSTF
jgi:hypothetical protein